MGVAEGQVGPVEARLAGYGQVRGLVFGAFGEASEAVHEFVQVVAQAKAAGGPGRAGGSRGEVAKLVHGSGANAVGGDCSEGAGQAAAGAG